MNRPFLTAQVTALAAATLLAAPAIHAQEASAAPTPASTAEPKVQRIVLEDEGSRIEELRVRGNTQRIVVTPKVGTKRSYEIIAEDGSREMFDGANTSRGAAGKRVWHILSF